MFNKKKRGAIEIQFNWIFVLIAGFVILLFIISLILSQKKSADAQINLEVIGKLQSSLTAKAQSSNSYNEIELMQTTLQFTCDKDLNYSDFKIAGASAQQLPVQIIFSQKSLSGTKLQTWTQDFDLPFQVTRFLYITTPDIAYVFYQGIDEDNALTLFTEFPSNMTKFYTDSPAELQKITSDFKNTVIVCFETNPSSCPPATYNYIKIAPSYSLDSTGTITFHKSGKPDTSINYITKSSIYGAIFSNNIDFYECQMNRALSQFSVKRNLTEERIALITNSSYLSQNCIPIYSTAILALRNMKDKTLQDSELLYNNLNIMELGNNDLVLGGCPLVY